MYPSYFPVTQSFPATFWVSRVSGSESEMSLHFFSLKRAAIKQQGWPLIKSGQVL